MLEWKATCSNSCAAAYPHQDMRGEGKGDYPVCMPRVGWRGRIMEGEIKSPFFSSFRAAL